MTLKRRATDVLLSTAFWGDDGEWVVVAEDRKAYGRFFNKTVAYYWAEDANVSDRPLGQWRIECRHAKPFCEPPFDTVALDNEDYKR